MPSQYSKANLERAVLTLENITQAIDQLIAWNDRVTSSQDYYLSQNGMQLLAANCTLITAIGEGINRIDRVIPDFLSSNFPNIPWRAIVGMRNHIAHGYFELDADIVFEAVKNEMPPLKSVIEECIRVIKDNF